MAEREPFATIEDVKALWRSLTMEEEGRATALLPVVSDSLRQEAFKVGKDLDEMLNKGELLDTVVKSVTVDVVARTLMTATEGEPLTQFSQAALGYSVSGTFLVPGGGLFIKNAELKRLGLKRQKIGVMEIYDTDPRYYG